MNGAARLPVLVPLPFEGPLDYLPTGGAPFSPGTWVEVKVAGRKTLGCVWDAPAAGPPPPANKLKPIARALDMPPLKPQTRRFLERMADYTLTPLGMAFRLATRAPGLETPPPGTKAYRLGARAADVVPTPARRRVFALFDGDARRSLTLAEITAGAGVGASVVSGLAAAGALAPGSRAAPAPGGGLKPDHAPPTLNPDQGAAALAMTAAVSAGKFAPLLLDGATGAGKTETYLEAVAEALRRGRQALVLLPEIALTADFAARVERRFGAAAAEWHSGVSPTKRAKIWRGVLEGATRLVIGARSALFLPFRELGLIVVDEEHDSSYKQEEVVLYNARDMAVLRASIEGCAVVLTSATPSIETWANAESGRYRRLSLPLRHGGAAPPAVGAIDLRIDPPERGSWIAPRLIDEAAQTLSRGEQTLFFLNRRGYAPLTLCRKCGWRAGCPNCTAWLVEHRSRNRLVCHHCGHAEPLPVACPKCESKEHLAACGPGVERVAEEVKARFPTARLAILSSDSAPDAETLKAEIARVAAGEADMIVGTQIVAKGHHFPNLTLMGVIDADIGLHGGDLRAGERTAQLLTQAAGRVGRASKPGRAWLQTTAPDHPAIKAILANDGEGFRRAEAAARRAHADPPFGRDVAVIVAGDDEKEVHAVAQALARTCDPLIALGGHVLGPAPAPFAILRGKRRMRLLARFPRGVSPQGALRAWRDGIKTPPGVRVVFDVDPLSFL